MGQFWQTNGAAELRSCRLAETSSREFAHRRQGDFLCAIRVPRGEQQQAERQTGSFEARKRKMESSRLGECALIVAGLRGAAQSDDLEHEQQP